MAFPEPREYGLRPARPERSSLPAQGCWTKPPAPEGGPPVAALVLGVAALGLFLLAAFLGSVFVAVPAYICAFFSAIVWKRGGNPMLGVDEADRMLVENPDDLDVCLVRLTVMSRGRFVGRDKGVVWFADGMLLYNGHRTSFVLGGEDVLPKEQWPVVRLQHSIVEIDDTVVPLRVPKGSASIELIPLGSFGSPAEMRFLKRLYEFRLHPSESHGPRQWPPLEANP